MNNRIVNFQLKKVVNQDARGGLGTSVVVNPLAALHPAININYPFYPPPPRFNCELTLSNRCFSVARSVRANPLTPFPIGLTRTHPVGKTLLCLFLAGYFSARPSYPITRVRNSTLDFQTGKGPKVLDLFDFVGSDVPLSADTKFTIVNSNRTDSGQFRLSRNAGVDPRMRDLAPVILKTRGMKDASAARHTKPRAYVRSLSTANVVGVDECA
jgi:hypothetical protein